MNFFEAQDEARRASRRLVVAYLIATLLIVAGVTAVITASVFLLSDSHARPPFGAFLAGNPVLPGAVASITTLFILGASVSRTVALSSGGGRVARDMGGTPVPAEVNDPLRRRLRNVVEEMAIASGVPVPDIYVLEQESGINAFAAGSAPGDAAVAVTRGALEMLSRDELQGVIGHEFSHILNGDMRLNIRLMGVLFGIMGLALIGRLILRGGRHVDDGRTAIVVLALGFGMTILGAIGMFMARVIKAGVSRQREFLADASAVQFTRQTDGIAGALKKIGGYEHGSTINATDPEEVSHMLFGAGASLAGLYATHPPLVERIRALDPGFDASELRALDPQRTRSRVYPRAAAAGGPASEVTAAVAAGGERVRAGSIADTVGEPGVEHVEYARHLRGSIPESLYGAAHSTEFAYLLTIALVLDRSGRVVDRQLALAGEQLGADRAGRLRRYYDEILKAGTEYRLPLLEIAFPTLKLRPEAELSYLVSLAMRMIEVDGRIDLYEYCFYRILTSSLGQFAEPARRKRARRPGRDEIRRSAVGLLRILADYGHDDDETRRRAFRAGVDTLGDWARKFEYA
ncbi:MAG: M48 family metallopeptidase, partial [Proteobacteria bacterium]|nr:M48 family metallopeptidase [Pseudomonadota bacterium]